jgi:hypothetical protein
MCELNDYGNAKRQLLARTLQHISSEKRVFDYVNSILADFDGDQEMFGVIRLNLRSKRSMVDFFSCSKLHLQ